MAERSVFAHCLNARDLGGHRAATGTRIPPRRLLRSDHVAAAAFRNRYDAPGRPEVVTLIDLRSRSELGHPAQSIGEAVGLHLPLENPQRGMTPEDWRNPHAVGARYLELLVNGSESVAEILAILTDPASYPVAIHCSGGKDRTGIVVALLLALLGVCDEDIGADYALSGFGAARLLAALPGWSLRSAPTGLRCSATPPCRPVRRGHRFGPLPGGLSRHPAPRARRGRGRPGVGTARRRGAT